MKPHKKTLLVAACAAGLMMGLWGCVSQAGTIALLLWGTGIIELNPDPEGCAELTDGGTLDCLEEGDEPCELAIGQCTYYRLGKYRILVEMGEGEVYQRRSPVENYDDHSPAREELKSRTELDPPPEYYFDAPFYVDELPGSVWLKLGIFDTETEKWAYLDFSTYRAPVSPEVTYENTVWGKLRKQGDETYYAWHVVPRKSYEAYEKAYDGVARKVSDWDPEKPIHWQPGEKEAHDALAKEVSLSLPLPGEYEAYGLGFTFGAGYHPPSFLHDGTPGHLVASFTEDWRDSRLLKYTGEYGEDTLKFNIRK